MFQTSHERERRSVVDAPVAQHHAKQLAVESVHPISAAFDFSEISKALKGVSRQQQKSEHPFEQFVPDELGEEPASDVVMGPPEEDNQLDEDDIEIESITSSTDVPFYQTFWAYAIADYMQSQKVKYDKYLQELRVEKRGEEVHNVIAGRPCKKQKIEKSGRILEGDERVRKMREIYTRGFRVRIENGEDESSFRYITPSDDQLLFLESCLFACLPKIYGESDWATHHYRILGEWGRKEIDYFLMMITARRVGKTTSMSMFDAAFLLTVPGRTIAVFSTGKRASKALKELVEKFIGMTGEANKKRIINSNQEELFIAHSVVSEAASKRSQESQDLRMHPSTAKLFSYPSTVKGNLNENKYRITLCGESTER